MDPSLIWAEQGLAGNSELINNLLFAERCTVSLFLLCLFFFVLFVRLGSFALGFVFICFSLPWRLLLIENDTHLGVFKKRNYLLWEVSTFQCWPETSSFLFYIQINPLVNFSTYPPSYNYILHWAVKLKGKFMSRQSPVFSELWSSGTKHQCRK